MDLHIIIVIACVFLASLISLLFIHKFFRGKTFEEMATEKRLLAEKLYGTKSKRAGSNTKRSNANTHGTNKSNKRKNSNPKSSSNTPNATNKIEPVTVKEDTDTDCSNAEDNVQPEKVVQEVPKKQVKEQVGEIAKPQKAAAKESKKTKHQKKETPPAVVKEHVDKKVVAAIETVVATNTKAPAVATNKESTTSHTKEAVSAPHTKETVNASHTKEAVSAAHTKEAVTASHTKETVTATSKEARQPTDEKLAKQVDSPKIQSKQNKPKKKVETNVIPPVTSKKEYAIPTVNSIMSILSRAEFTRNEIQILIDYLLNKQQDTTANHSEWSDDIVQKLRKKLEEKEKAIEEEQAASAGIQAKLRELRTTLNTERVQHNASVKAYIEEVQGLKAELLNANQDMNERMEKMKEQYNLLKMQSENFNPQLVLTQLNYLNQYKDSAKRNAFINQILEILQPQNEELTQIKNENMALRNEILLLNNQNNSLMMSFNEAENKMLCQKKELDDERANSQMQINSLQAALDAAKSEIIQLNNNNNNMQSTLDTTKSELMLMQTNSQNHVHNLSSQIDDLNRQLVTLNNKCIEQNSETNELRTVLNNYKITVQEKEQKIADYETDIRNLINKEDVLMKQLQEQKEKNNDLRTKNWKLVEALQKAEAKAVSKNLNSLVQPVTISSQNQEERLRELLHRLFPDAVAMSAGSALSLSFDQWVEQVISTHINDIVKKHQAELKKHSEQLKQQLELNNISNSTSNDNHNTSSNHNESINNHKEHSNNGISDDVILENARLRAQVAELKSVVINTENTLKNIELQAQDQESKWRNVVKVKQEEIDMLKGLNRQAV